MHRTSSLRGQGELLAYIPYQLGFTPVDSVVLVGFDDRGLLTVTVRFDALTADDADDVNQLIGSGRLREVFAATLVVYTARVEPEGPGSPGDADVLTTASLLASALSHNGTHVDHLLHVDEAAQWRALLCDCRECPHAALPLPAPEHVPAVVSAVVGGVDPALTRADLEGLATSSADDRIIAAEVGQQLQAVSTPASRITGSADRAAIGRLLTEPDAAADMELLVAATRGIQAPAVRDAALCWSSPVAFDAWAQSEQERRSWRQAVPQPSPPPEDVAKVVGCLIRWARRVPESHAAQIWATAAALEWARGGSATATIAIDRGLAADPGNALCHLVRRCLSLGVMPRHMTEQRTA